MSRPLRVVYIVHCTLYIVHCTLYTPVLNLCKKVPRKKVSGKKNLEIKTLEKSPNFLKSLEKMSLEIKSCVLDS